MLGLAGVALLLVVVFSALEAKYGDITDRTWHSVRAGLVDAGLALGVALLVALVVGLLVDRAARARLAERLAETWLWGLLGQDAPPQLQQRAKVLLENRVVLSLDETEMRCSWVSSLDPSETCSYVPGSSALRLELQSLQTGTNYGPEPFRVQPSTTLIPSLIGLESRVTHWEFEVYPRDRSENSEHICLSAEDLSSHFNRHVRTTVSAKDLGIPQRLEARRGDGFRLLRRAEVFLGESDCLPLASLRPSIYTVLRVTGPALSDIEVDVWSSHDTLEPADEPDGGGLKFVPGASLSREWMWVCWTPTSSPTLQVLNSSADSNASKPAEELSNGG